jgi:hypothetical protein
LEHVMDEKSDLCHTGSHTVEQWRFYNQMNRP